MAFSTKQIYIVNEAVTIAPTGHSVNVAPAANGTEDIVNQEVTYNLPATGAGAVKATAFDTLLKTTLVTSVDTTVGTTMGVDTTTYTVKYNCKVYSVTRGLLADDIFFNEANDVFVVKCLISVAVS